jgi:threonine/homoserine/homoserine lactone efflux protein
MNWLVGARFWLSLLGGAALMVIAWHTYRQPVAARSAALPRRSDLARCFAGTFLLTLSNPSTIFSFIAVFASIAGARAQAPSAWPLIAGVAAGSALWWLLLSAFVSRWRHHFDATWRRRINHLSAVLLAGFALWQWGAALAQVWR